MNEGHVLDHLADYVLDCLDAPEKRAVEQHLASCAICRSEWLSLQEAANELTYAVAPVEPPVRLKKAILQQIAAPVKKPAPSRTGWYERLRLGMRGISPVWGIASLALILVLAISNALMWQQVRQLSEQASSPMHTIAMVGDQTQLDATGLLVVTANGRYGTLVVDGLDELDAQYQYQLWLIADGQRTSGGVFSVDRWGYGALVVDSPRPLLEYTSFGVTVEPAGGSPGPTGERVLSGNL